jgi:hypothetical protein
MSKMLTNTFVDIFKVDNRKIYIFISMTDFCVSTKFNSHESSNAIKFLPNQMNHHNHVGVGLPIIMNNRPINPLNHNCISAMQILHITMHGLNGSLSESSESVPVPPENENDLNLPSNVSVLDEQFWSSPLSKFQWN